MGKSRNFLANPQLLLDFVKFRSSLRRFVARIVEPQDIDDILQETYIRVCAAAEKKEITNPKSFMLKTAQNLSYNFISTAYQRRVQLEDFDSVRLEQLSSGLESQFESRERFLGFCRAVRALPLQCRRVFILSKVYGFSQQEIAEYLDISESTVEKHIAKGLLLCRDAMLRMGHIEKSKPARPGDTGKRFKHVEQ